jgi:hypothetical protein
MTDSKQKEAGRPRITYPPLTEAQLDLCPNGSPRCRLCQLRPDQIKELHKKRFEEKYTYKKIRKYIKDTFNMGEDYTRISNHFNKHVDGNSQAKQKLKKRRKDVPYPEVMKALEPISSDVKISTSGELEKAYEQLVKMAQTFTDKVNKIQNKIAITVDGRDLDDELDGVPVLELLEKQSKLNKEAREFVKEVSILRAPKVMVAQFLESFIDSVIKEISILIANLAGELKHDITAELIDAGHPDMLSDATFADIFKKMALDYRDRMVNLKRQKMADALSALQDLEKLI